jgi:hypothetical protein
MKNSLYVLLVLSPCPAVAQDARVEFQKITLGDIPYSLMDAIPSATPSWPR